MKQLLYLYTDLFALTELIETFKSVNPRTYTQIYTPTGGEGVYEIPSQSFWYAAVFQIDFSFSEKSRSWSSQQGEGYLWVVALLEACEGTNNCRILATILDFPKN